MFFTFRNLTLLGSPKGKWYIYEYYVNKYLDSPKDHKTLQTLLVTLTNNIL